MNRGFHIVIGGLLALALSGQAWAQAEVGSPAPEFCLPSSDDSQDDSQVCLKDFRDKHNVVLLFYVLDFTSG